MKAQFIEKVVKSKAVTSVAKFFVSNAPKILTGVSIVSSLAAAVFVAKGTIKAVEIEEQRKEMITNGDIPEPEHPKLAVVQSVWKCYIPAAAFLTISIGTSLYGSNIALGRAAMATATCKATELAFDEYKAKVAQEIGEDKEKKIRQDIAKENAEQVEVKTKIRSVMPFEKYLCQEKHSEQKFYSNLYEIKDAFNQMNYDLMYRGSDYISFSTYLSYFDLDSKKEDIGWCIGQTGLLQLSFTSELDEYDRPILVFGASEPPYDNYNIYG